MTWGLPAARGGRAPRTSPAAHRAAAAALPHGPARPVTAIDGANRSPCDNKVPDSH